MSNTLRVKRRALGGASGAPSSLQQSELAWSEVDQILYIGQGSGGGATVVAIAGPGSYATKSYVDSAVSAVDVSSQLANYVTNSSLSSTLGSYVTSSSLSSTLSSYATSSSVTAAISSVINAAPAALDTLKELADALGSDASFSTTVTNSLSGKLTTANNLSELTATASTARTNLGLGSMATQSASNVAITGGSIAGIDLSGGTF